MNESEYGLLRMVELLQAVHSNIDGIVSAPTNLRDYPTGSVNPMDMPMVLSIPDEGTWDMFDMSAQDKQIRRFNVKLLVSTNMTGLDGQSLETTVQLIQRLGQAYTRRNTQQLQAAPSQILINDQDVAVTDTGVTALVAWMDELYWGAEFVVTLYEKYTIGESG
jgi:hypothetical protein